MEKRKISSWLIALILAMIIFGYLAIITKTPLLALMVIVCGLLLGTGVFTIPNKPQHIGLITRWDQKIWNGEKPVFAKEGLNWVLLKGIMHNIIPINIELKQREFEPQKVLTPDNVSVKVPTSYAWKPDPTESHKYINVGEEKGVDTAIEQILEGRLREYSRHPDQGPMSWKEMIASGLKTLDYLVKGFCDSLEDEDSSVEKGCDSLIRISNKIPTPILLDWYSKKYPPNYKVREQWGDGKSKKQVEDEEEEAIKSKTPLIKPKVEDSWGRLEESIKDEVEEKNKKIDRHNEASSEKKKRVEIDIFKEELEKKIKKRIDFLEKLQKGDAQIKIPNLGIYLSRLTVGDVDPFGPIYEAEIALDREEKEGKSETYEVEVDLKKAQALQKAIGTATGKEVNLNECFDAIMKWKMIGSGKGFVYEGQLGSFAGLGNLISSIIKGGKS